jgi:hypothetical protein
MQLTCPCCAARFPVEAALMDEAARAAVQAALVLPAGLAEPVLRYLALFRPRQRALAWDRAAKLLGELAGPIREARVERHGRAWAAPQEVWAQGLDLVLARRDSLTLPLKSHGYLYEVVAGLVNAREGAAEARHEAELRSGTQPQAAPRPVRRTGLAQVGEHLAALRAAAAAKAPPDGDD